MKWIANCSGNFDSMIRNVIMNVLLPAIAIFITDNLYCPGFGSLILSPKILYGNEYDGKMALLSPKTMFYFSTSRFSFSKFLVFSFAATIFVFSPTTNTTFQYNTIQEYNTLFKRWKLKLQNISGKGISRGQPYIKDEKGKSRI